MYYNDRVNHGHIASTGFVDLRLSHDEPPMFVLDRVDYSPPAHLVHMVVSNNIVVLALSNNSITRIDLENPSIVDIIEISRKSEGIHKVFLDPTGRHLIISMQNGENFYVHGLSQKPKALSKMRGHVIESVAFNRAEGTSSSTKEILIGTSKGLIYEAEIEPSDSGFFTGKEEKYFKQVYNLELDQAVCGLRLEPFSAEDSSDRKYFIMAATRTRMYQFIGNTSTEYPIFLPIFNNYITNRVFQEIPSDLDYTELQVFCKFQGLPRSFAWLTGVGVYYGNLVFGSQNAGESVATDASLLPFPANRSGVTEAPISLVSTEFHFLMLQKERLVAVCSLNESVAFVQNLYIHEYGEVLGLCIDQTKNTIWCFSASTIFEITVNDETRNIWNIYLEKQQFDTAWQYCKNKPEQADIVLTAQAEHYFEKGRYQLAADYYARTTSSFEEIALRFIERGERDAVKIYLSKKLEGLKPSDKPQITMLSTWLVEIYLNRLDELQDENNAEGEQQQIEEFRNFLSMPRVKDHVNHATVFELMNSHGRVEEVIFFAILINDYNRVIRHYITQGEYSKALDVLCKHNNLDFFYKYSSILLVNSPNKTIDAWMQSPDLDPREFVPALARYTATFPDISHEEHCGVIYLEWCVHDKGVTDPAIHNYLISLLVATKAEEKLLHFLDESFYYDKQYALRLCTQEKQIRACVQVYNLMELYEEAVELALQVDVELAKTTATLPYEDEELCRKLWLRIAKYVIESEEDIGEAMQFLEEPSLLKIEDILPFFPDFVTIDYFKDAICQSLETYNQHIKNLKSQMHEATQSAKLIRKDIQELKNKYGIINPGDKCALCKQLLLTRQFYMFPCKHLFHANCLYKEVLQHLTPAGRTRVNGLLRKIGAGTMPNDPHFNEDTMSIVIPQIDKLKAELDDLVAGECLLCGMVMIKSIDEPFISPEEADSVAKSWAL